MIDKIICIGYQDDGVTAFGCLNCYKEIHLRYSRYEPIEFCPFCGIKFSGAFIKDNKYKFYIKDEHGYNRYPLAYLKTITYTWELEVKETHIYEEFGDPIIYEWEKASTMRVDTSFRYGTREYVLNHFRQLKKEYYKDLKQLKGFNKRDIIEFRLVYIKHDSTMPYPNNEVLKYYYPKENKIIIDYDSNKIKDEKSILIN